MSPVHNVLKQVPSNITAEASKFHNREKNDTAVEFSTRCRREMFRRSREFEYRVFTVCVFISYLLAN